MTAGRRTTCSTSRTATTALAASTKRSAGAARTPVFEAAGAGRPHPPAPSPTGDAPHPPAPSPSNGEGESRSDGGEVRTPKAERQRFPKGSYVIRMDQPYSRMADMLLDTQYYNVNDPRPYDDTGWTLGALRNVKAVRVTDKSVLQTPMTLLNADAKVTGAITGVSSSPVAYLIN